MTTPEHPPALERLLGRGDATIPDLLRARASESPDRTFVTWEGRAWTFAEVLHNARCFAGWAIENSLAPPTARRVASFLSNSPEALWAWLGVSVSGAVYVPLNRSHRGELLLDMLQRSGADVLVTERAALEALPDLSETLVSTVLIVDGSDDGSLLFGGRVAAWSEVEAATPADGPDADAADTAVVMYTSGTTGRSKAVLMPHNELCRGAGWVVWSLDITEDDVIHAWLPLFHVAGQLDQVLAMLVAGGEVALYPTFSRSRFWSQIEACGATIFIGFSNVLELIWTLPERPEDPQTTLRAGIMGAIPANLHRAFEERFRLELNDVYGMTEAEPLILPVPGERPPVGAAGRPNPDFEICVLDDRDVPVPTGEVGEIAVRPRRRGVMFAGYEGDELATVEATRSMWFHTGDLGRADSDGFLYFVDRKKHAIRRRGENISSFELESITLRHPDVAECTAVGVPSPLGEEDVKLVVTLQPDRQLEPPSLRTWCTERMAAFMVPRYIEILDELPRTPTGKVLKQQLKENGAATWDAEREHVGR